MTTVAGASQFVNAAKLANTRGLSAQAPSLLGAGTDTASLLDSGRGIFGNNGIGLKSSARAINSQFISQTQGLANSLLSLAAGSDATVDGARQKILALRASLPDSAISRQITGENIDVEA